MFKSSLHRRLTDDEHDLPPTSAVPHNSDRIPSIDGGIAAIQLATPAPVTLKLDTWDSAVHRPAPIAARCVAAILSIAPYLTDLSCGDQIYGYVVNTDGGTFDWVELVKAVKATPATAFLGVHPAMRPVRRQCKAR